MKYLKILYLCYAVVLFLVLYEWLLPSLAGLKPVEPVIPSELWNGVSGPAGDSGGPGGGTGP